MPKRYRQQTQRNQEDGEPTVPPRKKKKRFPRWIGLLAISAGSAVAGGLAWRKFEEYFPRKAPVPDEAPPPPQQQLAAMGMGGFPMPMPVPMPMPMPMFPPAPARQPAPAPVSDMTIGEVKQLLKRMQQEEKAQRARMVEAEFWEQ